MEQAGFCHPAGQQIARAGCLQWGAHGRRAQPPNLLLGRDILTQRPQPLQVIGGGQQALNLGHGSCAGRLSLRARENSTK